MMFFPSDQIAPWFLASLQDISEAGFTALAANTAYLCAVVSPAPVVVSALRGRFSTSGNGNFDVGIYDAGWNGVSGTSNRLAHSGSTPSSGGLITSTLATPVALKAGQYWLAFWIDNAVDTTPAAQYLTATYPCQSLGSLTGGLPATITGLANQTFCPFVQAIFKGGWA